jgi:hypothetical protein
MTDAMSLALFSAYSRGSIRVITPDGMAEDQAAITDLFHGILTAAAARLQEAGREEEAAAFRAKTPKPVSVDLEALLRIGYRIEGVPDSIWNLLLIGNRATA